MSITEVPDSGKVFQDEVFHESNESLADEWTRIGDIYPNGAKEPLLPETFSRDMFGQGKHYECFMMSALATLVRYPDVIRNCFITKKVRQDGRYTFQFFRGKEWVKVEIDDRIAMEEGDVLYLCSPTEHWWPLLLEKAYAKFYTSYENIEGCTLQETFHDLTGLPVLNIPMDAKLAKTAGADVAEGSYWLDLSQRIQDGLFVASILTKDMELENMGLQPDQQYGVLEIFSLTGTSSVGDIVVHMHNPFEDEEFIYKGPMNPKDSAWTPKLRAKYDVDNERSIFLPLSTLLKIANSLQLCYVTTLENDATYYDDEWKGETAGGNPTSSTWRKNPLYYVRNSGTTAAEIVVMIKQEDQRRFTSPEEMTKYLQCGIILTQYSYPNPIPTFWVTGNNHKPIHKSLFLNSREVSNAMTIPHNSICYLVPSGMNKGAEGEFTLALYRVKNVDYSDITIQKLDIPGMDWKNPAGKDVCLRQKEKDRIDFVVDEATDIHILNHQKKPFISKSGGDAMTEDYMGMYLYDDTDRRIGGVHAATNFREVSIIHHLPRSGRFAISLTCPRAKGEVPAFVTIVGSHNANVRIVDPPEDATMFDDEDEIIEDGDAGEGQGNPIDYFPVVFEKNKITEVPDSNNLYEDKRFLVDNKNVTNEAWIHIGDLYPEGKNVPLLPDKLSRDQFEQGENYECCAITAFAALVDKHPDVIRNCFVTKNPRKDGRYTFQFHRYGQWVKVEIDDRIPCIDGQTAYCRSPTHNWWPLLLEKAYAKFYTLYQNLENCTQQEVFHDFSGRPVISIQTDPVLAQAANYDIQSPEFWSELNRDLDKTALAGLTKMVVAAQYGLNEDQSYGILGFVPISNTTNPGLADIAVKLYNPFVESDYTGPLCKTDGRWPNDMKQILNPDDHSLIYMPVPTFCEVFLNIQQAWIKGPLEPAWNFNSEWGEGTNGGNPTLSTWRDNPLYVINNARDFPLDIIAMIRQPDQRHLLHLSSTGELNYIQCGLILTQSTSQVRIPTYLVTGNNHRTVHKGLFLNSREVANVITIPEESMCYLVPSAMYRDMGKFILSYWYLDEEDKKDLDIVRYKCDVARSLPAIDHLELRNKEKDRVDFLVDVPTDVHILLHQEKPFKNESGGDAMAEDFLAFYLYDGNNKRMTGTLAATNYRDIGLVHHLDEPGRYALSITCPSGNGSVPCRVEVVATEQAHVRITDAPDNAPELGEVDLTFLDPEPEGVPLADLPLYTDPEFQDELDALKNLVNDERSNDGAIRESKERLNDRAHELAKYVIGKDRPKYLPEKNLETLGPLLNANDDYMGTEKERYGLKKRPKNIDKVRVLEGELRVKADEIEEFFKLNDLGFMDPEYEGIPVEDLELMNDPAFNDLALKRMQYLQNPAANASKIGDVEDAMHERAREIAKDMHDKERVYLDQEPEGVPLDLLPLNEDAPFSQMEDELRALKQNPAANKDQIKALEGKLNDRAHELAAQLKHDERELFLDPQPLGVPIAELPLDDDAAFHDMEIERLRLRAEDPVGNKDRIRELEDAMNERARELAKDNVVGMRDFLEQEPRGVPLVNLNLDDDRNFKKLEDQLRDMQKDPNASSTDIEAHKDKMRSLVDNAARAVALEDRAFLDPEPEGRLVSTLPLDDDRDFVDLDTERRKEINAEGESDKTRDMEKAMNDIAHEIAHELNKKERPDFLKPTYKGIAKEDLPLDEDKTFRDLEVKRQVQKRDPRRNANAVKETEKALDARAEELAGEIISGDRAYLDPNPEGVPLELLPLDEDKTFKDLETERAQLKKDPERNGKKIADAEEKLNDRAHELAKNLKEGERKKFLDPRPGGIPADELLLDDDEAFRDLEVQRLALNEDPRKNAREIKELEDALNERAAEIGGDTKNKERGFLDPAPLGVPLEELPLDSNKDFVAKEDELRQLRKSPAKNAAPISALEDKLNDMARQIAADELAGNRNFLDPEPEGRLLSELPLETDPEFHDMELEYRDLKKNPAANAQKLADLEELMNDRAHQLAKQMNAAERPTYMNPDPLGVPLDELPLDTDPEFSDLEAQRAKLKRDPVKNKAAIKDLENALNARAEELAKEKIQADRDFMDKEPNGVPLKYIPLDDDKAFKDLETKRQKMKGDGVRDADPKMRELETAMNDRAKAMADDMRKNVRDEILPDTVKGLPKEVLHVDEDKPFNDLEIAYVKADGDGEEEKKRDLADAMVKRAGDLTDELRQEERANLGSPLGYAASELPLDSNPEYMNKEGEVISLRAGPKAKADSLPQKEQELKDIALEIAREKANKERDYIDDDLEGNKARDIDLLADPVFAGLEEEYHRGATDPYADRDHLSDLEKLMNDRAHELARQKNAEERDNFIQEQRNVPLSELPLDTDEKFQELEAERARLKQDPKNNRDAIKNVEDQMNDRVGELTDEVLKGDRIFLDDEPDGVLLRQVDIDNDPKFRELEQQRAALKNEDPRKNAAAIRDLEDQMNDRLHELAKQTKWDARGDMDQNPSGIPLKDLGDKMDNDKRFHDIEEMYRDARKDPKKQIEADKLLQQMNERAKELADEMHEEERAKLDQDPEGIPLNTLPLNEDEKFLALENEARQLRNEPNGERKNAERLADLEDMMNERAKELADEARKEYIDPYPEGVPLELLHLGDDSKFVNKENELRRLEKNPKANAARIAELKGELNDMAQEKARDMLRNDRDYLDPKPEGVDIRHVPIDSDPQFREMEAERARLKTEDPQKNQKGIADLEEKLNDRAHELAKGVKEDEMNEVHDRTLGVPVSELKPHDDEEFNNLAQQKRELELDPKKNANALNDVKGQMKNRAENIAADALKKDRAYLDPKPEGVDVNALPLDDDKKFHDLEIQRAKLKGRGGNPAKIKDLEDQLNARAAELAREQKKKDLEGLDKKPEGIPLEILDPHNDDEFASYLPQLRELKKDPKGNKEAIADLQQKMNDRAHELAAEKLRGDRDKYVEDEVDGVPRDILPLDTDPKFKELETQRAILRAQDPRRNADKIKDLENQLNDRAHELAAEQKKKDLENLDQNPEGIPIELLNAHDDPEFAKMVDEHRELMKDPKANANALADLEDQMNERAKELAKNMKNNDRAFLDPEPEGVPLSVLPLDTDTAFKALEAERAKLKARDPRRNAAKIKSLEEQMNDRAHELAKKQLKEDLSDLNQQPRELPLELLKPHSDEDFAALVDQSRALKANPKSDQGKLNDIRDKMDSRADELAAAVLNRDFLDQAPEGVPLADLPLDTDPTFHNAEVERGKLKLKDPIRNRKKIEDLEGKMNDRAHELAQKQLKDDLAACEANPRGLPVDVINPQQDEQISEMLPRLRALKKDPVSNKDAIKDLEDQMKKRSADLADKLLENDRGYLDPKPNNVPLKYLPLSTDPTFSAKEAERATLKAQNPRRNARAITQLEDDLNKRARQLADEKKHAELKMFPAKYEDIPTTELKPHDDPEFAKILDNYRDLELEGTENGPEGKLLKDEMNRRLEELAKEKKDGDLWFLDKEPEGIPVEQLPLREDPQFAQMQQERTKMKSEDPRKNANKIADLEKQMNDRAHDLAKELKDSDFDGVDPAPRGMPLELLRPRDDPQVQRILPDLRKAKQKGDKKKTDDLLKQLNDRVDDLAQNALTGERPAYLDAEPEGVPIAHVPLDSDGIYTGLELERAKMKLQDPEKNGRNIDDLEDRLNNRAHELASEVLKDDLKNLGQDPRGIPIESLQLHNDPAFKELANQRRNLAADPKRNAKKIEDLEKKMNDIADKCAEGKLSGDRDYLNPEPEGVPLDILPLDTDPIFHDFEVERAVLKTDDPKGSQQKIKDLEDQLNDRAKELARNQLKDDLSGLNQAPLGVPIGLLNPHEDAYFAAMLPELRRLKEDPKRNEKKINDLNDKLDDRLLNLAQDYLEKDRPTYLDAAPNGIPLKLLPLDTDPEFKNLEAERLDLIDKNPKLNQNTIEELEDALNERAKELANNHKKQNRDYLDPEPEGVPVDALPLDTDRQFKDLESRRAALAAEDPKKNMNAIRDLEDQLNDRAHQLAKEQLEEDLKNVDPNPLDIPLMLLHPMDDPEFKRMVNAVRALNADPSEDPSKIAALEADMNDRAMELAEEALKGDREKYLDAAPEGIPIAEVPIDSDPLFHQLEVERAKLNLEDPVKNKNKIDDLNDRLNDRAHELAKDVKNADLEGLPSQARGIPIDLLNPHDDPTFADLASKSRSADPQSKQRSIDVDPTNDPKQQRLDDLAKDFLAKDRPQYLDPNPEGIPYTALPLDDDQEFHDMEVERAILKNKDPKKNADKIKELEGKLNDRSHQLAKDALAKDRDYLDQEPEGVPLCYLPLETDPKFHQMETERARLKARDPQKNAEKIKDLEDKLNNRGHELAKDQLAEDLEGLDQNPRGIPIADLNPHQDEKFSSFLPELRKLKEDPKKNAAKIKDIQNNLDNRLDELAKDKIAEERAFLDPTPEGIPLSNLPLDDDRQFKDLERQLRYANKDPKRNADKIKDLQEKMNDRAHELAKEKVQGDRTYLDPEPEGIPLKDVPLDDDEKFRDLELQRAKLKDEPEKNADAIKALEEQLNDRAHELAKGKKQKDREFLNPESHGIPKELLPLDDDVSFQKMEQQMRRLQADPKRNAAAIENLKPMMQDRADELGEQMLKGDRGNYLDDIIEGIPAADLPLDDDPTYAAKEKERAILKAKDPVKNKDEIEKLEQELNDRAHEVALEQKNNDRAFLDPEPEGIPIEDVPLDSDPNFTKMEDYLRKLKKNPTRNAQAIEDAQEKMNDRAHELAKGVVAEDLACLPQDKYRGIPKEDLKLHENPKFRDAANRRRKALRNPKRANDVAMIEDEMDAIAREIADDVIDNERAFLHPEPEGMDVHDLDLDNDPEFALLEAERRKKTSNPAAAKRNKEVVRDLEDRMNDRAHQMAKDAFAKSRAEFMDPEPNGVPLEKLPLDTDPEFKSAEIDRYKELKKENPDMNKVKDLEDQMNDRALELAKQELEKDRAFLDPEPEGVPLDLLNLEKDPEFQDLAKQRQALKAAGKTSRDPGVKDLEKRMNDRAHELAKDYLDGNRDYLDPTPEGVPLKDVPLNKDPIFREMENELMNLQKDPVKNKDKIEQLKDDLNDRANQVAKDLLKKERAGQEQEPLGVPLELLPLNTDPELNELERKRRELKKDPKKNADALRKVEADIEDRVNQIAQDFLDEERAFMDSEPEGVPLAELNLSDDPKFHDLETQLRELKKDPKKNADAIKDVEDAMNDRAHELAKDKLAKDRGFLEPNPLGVPVELLPLNDDPSFQDLEKQRRELKKNPTANAKAIRELEDQLNDRAKELAQDYLDKERAFMDPEPEGVPLADLDLEKDKKFHNLEKELRDLKKAPKKNADAIKEVQDAMNDRAHELAKRQLANDRNYLNAEPRGVPVDELPIDGDEEFKNLEKQRREAKVNPNRGDDVRDLEKKLNERADEIAKEYLKKDRAYLDPEPEGVPLDELPLDEDNEFTGMEKDRRRLKKDEQKNQRAIGDLENKLNERAHTLAKEKKGYQDPDFHEANEDAAEMWPRIRELYPEGVYDPVTPDTTLPSDVSSAPQDNGYLAPFIVALSRHTVMISRLFQDKGHPHMKPYRITLFNPDCSPATVEIDDRIPCDDNREPKFTRVPSRMWYPLLLEKAYAKFIGGYQNLNNCNAHDTLRDLTGRPVIHISLEDPKHAAAQGLGDFREPAFWRRVAADFARGDIYLCVANGETPDGIHPHCCYALMDIIEVNKGSEDPQDIILKVHNCYQDEPAYSGPLRAGDSTWSAPIKKACNYDPEETDVIYMPLPTFLDNFSCMQRCHINCGDRLSSPGQWNEFTAGGTNKFTTFRNNPIYLVENKTARAVTILAEVRHSCPMYIDESNCKRYPYTGLMLMQPVDSKLPPTPFITSGTHKVLHKGMMLDSREMCSEIELPPNSVTYLIPYTKDRGVLGDFHVSIYPDMSQVTLTPLRNAGLTLKPLKEELKIDPNDGEGTRVDFMLSDVANVHVLLHQNQVSDPNSLRRGDVAGESELSLSIFNEYGIKICTTGGPTNAREHALVFKAPQGGRYSILATCTTDEPCPATLSIFTTKDVEVDIVPVAPDAKPLNLQSASRFPTLSRTATAPSQSRERGSSATRRTDSLPPSNSRSAARRGSSRQGDSRRGSRRR